MKNYQQRAVIIPVKEIQTIRVELPKSWERAAGLLKSKGRSLDRHVRRVRKEWDR